MKVAVLGGGLSGLTVAHRLRRNGVEARVFEASKRPGGVIQTLRRDGFLMETAANGFLDREPATREVVDALGLTGRLRPASEQAKRRFLFTRGKLRAVPASPPQFLTSDVIPLHVKLGMARDLFASRGKGDESLAAFARRHIGADATRILIDAVQTGIFAGDVEKLSAQATFPKMVAMERDHRSLVLAAIRGAKARKAARQTEGGQTLSGVLTSFDGGMQTLVDTLAADLGDALQLESPAEALTRAGEGWKVKVGGAELDADRVILALPASKAADLLEPHDAEIASELRQVVFARVSVVHLGWEKLPEPPSGFGFLVPSGEGRKILGALYIHSFFPFRAPDGATLLTVMVGGARHPELAAQDDETLVKSVRDELAAMMGITAEPSMVELVRWDRAIPQYEVGHLARMDRVEARLAQLPGLSLLGQSYRGVGINDCIKNALALAGAVAGR